MDIYFEQIPEGASYEDYPPDTLFVLDDTRPKRDPQTWRLLPKEQRRIITPEEAWSVYNQEKDRASTGPNDPASR